MKEVSSLTLDSKECIALIAYALNIPKEDVTNLRYGFGIKNHSADEIAGKLAAIQNT